MLSPVRGARTYLIKPSGPIRSGCLLLVYNIWVPIKTGKHHAHIFDRVGNNGTCLSLSQRQRGGDFRARSDNCSPPWPLVLRPHRATKLFPHAGRHRCTRCIRSVLLVAPWLLSQTSGLTNGGSFLGLRFPQPPRCGACARSQSPSRIGSSDSRRGLLEETPTTPPNFDPNQDGRLISGVDIVAAQILATGSP